MPFRFRRQSVASPRRIGAGFRVTHIDGPVQGQWDLLEHRAKQPPFSRSSPEHRMFDAFLFFPTPSRVSPKITLSVTSGFNKFQILAVCDLVPVEGERRHIHDVRVKFVVPTEAAGIGAQRHAARWNLDHPRRKPIGRRRIRLMLADFSIKQQLMQHVRERFHMHQTMLDCDIQELGRSFVSRPSAGNERVVEFGTYVVFVLRDLLLGGPVRR